MMNWIHKSLLTSMIVFLAILFCFIIFGKNGYQDLLLLSEKQKKIQKKNETLIQENLILIRKINRLKTDPQYIESVARNEFKMIEQNETIFKIKKKKMEKK